MRVSEQSRLTARLGYLQNVTERLDLLQRQLATEKKVHRASDDPAGTVLSLGHRRDIAFEEQMRRNLSSGVAFMNATEAALDGATDALQRVRELTIRAANGPLGPDNRGAIAAEVDQLIGQLAQLANTNFAGAYIFSGHQTRTPAYDVTGSPPTAITFVGDTGERIRQISKQDKVAVNVSGVAVFGNIFDELLTLRDNLNTGATGSVIAASISVLDTAIDRMIDVRAEIGARVNRFEAAQRLSEKSDTDLQMLRAEIEDADITETVLQLSAQDVAFQAALQAIGRTSNMTLLNFLR
ncbi:MAG: flagellar hook-associated protein FlgL [Dehalococcoidia bacterium]|nr:flagellar hook-associated protein FlgL [Dehalococcoidia bacterium]